ncbi:MAG: hypothetical protein ILNGONEN_02531 [Syntrophorhabdaceae bacterium]|jgi:hypothetical protein|nr:hypothetical protein [Syntrophorhabdaceae bacterium]
MMGVITHKKRGGDDFNPVKGNMTLQRSDDY